MTPLDLTNSLTKPTKALVSVIEERLRQDAKWGIQDHDMFTWITILAEEFGEFAEAALHTKFEGKKANGLRLEAVQIAAVALAIVECIDRNNWKYPNLHDNR